MEGLMTFTQTCDKPYDRHVYQVSYTDGRTFLFSSYDELRAFWFQCGDVSQAVVHVIDPPKSKGFK